MALLRFEQDACRLQTIWACLTALSVVVAVLALRSWIASASNGPR